MVLTLRKRGLQFIPIILSAALSIFFTYLTLQAPGCPPSVLDCYGSFKQGGWPFKYLSYVGGGFAAPHINFVILLLDIVIFFVPTYLIIKQLLKRS